VLHRIAFPVMAEWCQTLSIIRALVRFLETLSDPRHPKQAKHRSVGLLVAVAVAVVMGTLRRPGPASLPYWCSCEGWDLPRGSAGSCGEPATDSSSAASASW
jgi:hypothetical protein